MLPYLLFPSLHQVLPVLWAYQVLCLRLYCLNETPCSADSSGAVQFSVTLVAVLSGLPVGPHCQSFYLTPIIFNFKCIVSHTYLSIEYSSVISAK